MLTCRWWTEKTVAIVTGANRGIGFAIVEKLAEFGLTVVLTCRSESKGVEAVLSLAKRGLTAHFCKLDVTDDESILNFASRLHVTFGGLDILVNNAGVSFSEIHSNNVEEAEIVIRTNFYGQRKLIQELLPLFRRSPAMKSRVLNISSQLALQT
ncbi:carbonyl reductase [NADPH] 1-like, partial [Phalaenopsis equestris]